MYLATLDDAHHTPVAVDEERGLAAVRDLIPGAPDTTLDVIAHITNHAFAQAVRDAPTTAFRPLGDTRLAAPYRTPRKIWGIGLNYVDHAVDLAETVPEEPASFMKGDHTIIGANEPIPLPPQSRRVTAEAELGLVMGPTPGHVNEDTALSHVWGVCPVLDQTAEDVLARNPRFLTRSKNFPGFLSFGPGIVPLSEVPTRAPGLGDIQVSTLLNGEVMRTNTVARMRYPPRFLVAFHSQVMPFHPGDLLSTGTPGAVVITPGDVAGCAIPGVGALANPVAEAHPNGHWPGRE